LDNVTSHAAPSLLKAFQPKSTVDVGSEVCRTCRRAPFTEAGSHPLCILFAQAHEFHLEILPKAIAEQIAEKHKISLPKYNRPFITERSAGPAQMGRGLGERSTGSLFAVARALPGRCLCSQEEDGDHGKHSFDCPTTHHSKPSAEVQSREGYF
jgi:hypothetical protein